MLAPLRFQLDGLERRRDALLRDLASLPPSALVHRPAPGAWTLAEVAQHLMLVERNVTRILAARADKAPLRRGPTDALRRLVMRVVLGRIRFRAPVEVIVPAPDVPFAQVREEWDNVRAGLRATLEGVTSTRLDQPIFRHPLAGVMTVPQTLDFLTRHHDHHLRQVRRLREAAVV